MISGSVTLNMFFKSLSKLFFLILLITPATGFSDPPKGYTFVGYNEGIKLAKASGKKIFLYYGRYGCGFCDKTNKESFSDPEVAQIYKSKYILVYVDAEGGDRITLPSGEQITEQQFGSRLKSLVTPYFMFLNPDGKPISRVPGFKTVDHLLLMDEFISKGLYTKMSYANYSR